MNSEVGLYRVTLVPAGVTGEESNESRTFEFETETTDAETLRKEAARAVVEQRVMDPTTFRDYWDIATVLPAEAAPTGLTALKSRLQACSPSRAQTLADQYIREYTVIRMHSIDPQTGNWVTHSMLHLKDMESVLKKWRAGLSLKYGRNGVMDAKIVSEAMIRTAHALDPDVASKIDSHPGRAHTRILALAIKHEDVFEKKLRPLLP